MFRLRFAGVRCAISFAVDSVDLGRTSRFSMVHCAISFAVGSDDLRRTVLLHFSVVRTPACGPSVVGFGIEVHRRVDFEVVWIGPLRLPGSEANVAFVLTVEWSRMRDQGDFVTIFVQDPVAAVGNRNADA